MISNNIEREYAFLQYSCEISRKQAELTLAYMGSVKDMEKMSKERLMKQLIRIPSISDKSALKIANIIKSKTTNNMKKQVKRTRITVNNGVSVDGNTYVKIHTSKSALTKHMKKLRKRGAKITTDKVAQGHKISYKF